MDIYYLKEVSQFLNSGNKERKEEKFIVRFDKTLLILVRILNATNHGIRKQRGRTQILSNTHPGDISRGAKNWWYQVW